MKKTILLLILTFYLPSLYSQDTISYFSDAIKANINLYNHISNHAYEKRDYKEGQRLFDSLVRYKLVGTQFDDFNIKSYYSKNVKLHRINKPIFIVTYSTWCVINKGEIPALNKLAKEHRNNIQFIVLFWDKKTSVKKVAHQFSDDIKICYANEKYYSDSHIISIIKNTLGFPTSFFIDENKKVISIRHFANKIKPRTSFPEALAISYENFSQNIDEALANKIVTR